MGIQQGKQPRLLVRTEGLMMKLKRGVVALSLGLLGFLGDGRVAFSAANQWRSLAFEGSYVDAIALDPSNPTVLYASVRNTSSEHIYKSSDSGLTWLESDNGIEFFEGVFSLTVSSVNPSLVVAVSGDAVFLSTDGGFQWTDISGTLPCFPNNAFALDSTPPGHIYIGTAVASFHLTPPPCDGTFKFTLGMSSWKELPLTDFYLQAILVDRSDPAIVYAGGTDMSRSIDGGTTWHLFNNSSTGPLHGISSLCESDWDSTGLYAVTPDAVWRTDTTSANRVPLSNGFGTLRMISLLADPARTGVMYAVSFDPATDVMHILRSEDGAKTWSLFEGGMPVDLKYVQLTIDAADRRLLAATNAGVFVIDLGCPPSRRCISPVVPARVVSIMRARER